MLLYLECTVDVEAAEKEFDTEIQVTMEHVLVPRSKKKEMDEKRNL